MIAAAPPFSAWTVLSMKWQLRVAERKAGPSSAAPPASDDTFAAGLGSERPTGAAAFADVDGDGWLDLFVGNEVGERRTHYASELYLNNRDGTFRDAAREAGLTVDAFVKGAVWTDAGFELVIPLGKLCGVICVLNLPLVPLTVPISP